MQNVIRFVKMHAIGNDFLILDRLTQSFFIDPQVVRALGHRRTGIGFDQLLILEPPIEPDHDFSYQIYNNNGTHSKQCLNGLRTLAHYIHDQGFLAKRCMTLVTDRTALTCEVLSHSVTKVILNRPQDAVYQERIAITEDLICDKVIVGGPHIVCWGTPKEQRAGVLQTLKNAECGMENFNISFALFDRDVIHLETYERGIGKTLSCGSAAIAAVLAHMQDHTLTKQSMRVNTQAGYVTVGVLEDTIALIGPVSRVFRGEFALRYQ